MKPKNPLFDIQKSIPSLLSLPKETKHIGSFCSCSWKETPTKDIHIVCTYSIIQDEHHENGFTMTSGKSFRMMNLLIQWIT